VIDISRTLPSKHWPLVVFFLLAFAITWSLWIPAALAEQGTIAFPVPLALAGLLGAWGPTLAGICTTAIADGLAGLRRLFGRLVVWRVGLRWYLFVLLWPVFLLLAVTGVSMLLGSPAPDFANPPVVEEYPLPPEALSAGFLPLLPMVLVIQFLGSSLGEEVGWRGFALPRMQAARSALLASVLLGVVWGIWHLPRFWIPGMPLDGAEVGWFMLAIILDTVLYTWVFNNTRGSLLPVLLLHTSQAVAPLFLAAVPNLLLENLLRGGLVVLVVAMSGSADLTREPLPRGTSASTPGE
jgi:membrane protease YdiL (CAAX protease family)